MRVAVVMGSDSDYKVMEAAVTVLNEFKIDCIKKVVSAHRTPKDMIAFAESVQEQDIDVIIAGAGGAAHLPGMLASCCDVPVIGVPVKLKALDGMDSLLSIVQMPKGVPVACMAIDNATNAGLLALRILGVGNEELRQKLKTYREELADVSRAKRV